MPEPRSSPFRIPLDALTAIGSGLVPPECVLATSGGVLYTADWRGGVACIHADHSQSLHAGTLPAGQPLRPNGIALRLKNISSLAFGGPDLRTAYLGCLLGDSLMSFRSPVAGQPPTHWYFPETAKVPR